MLQHEASSNSGPLHAAVTSQNRSSREKQQGLAHRHRLQGERHPPDVEVDDRIIQELGRVKAFEVSGSNFHHSSSPLGRVQRRQPLRQRRRTLASTVLDRCRTPVLVCKRLSNLY